MLVYSEYHEELSKGSLLLTSEYKGILVSGLSRLNGGGWLTFFFFCPGVCLLRQCFSPSNPD